MKNQNEMRTCPRGHPFLKGQSMERRQQKLRAHLIEDK